MSSHLFPTIQLLAASHKAIFVKIFKNTPHSVYCNLASQEGPLSNHNNTLAEDIKGKQTYHYSICYHWILHMNYLT